LVALSEISGGYAVLVQQTAEPVGSLDPVEAVGPLPGKPGDRGFEVGPAVRSLVVVVLHELSQVGPSSQS
jgi:hypothetical protein